MCGGLVCFVRWVLVGFVLGGCVLCGLVGFDLFWFGCGLFWLLFGLGLVYECWCWLVFGFGVWVFSWLVFVCLFVLWSSYAFGYYIVGVWVWLFVCLGLLC